MRMFKTLTEEGAKAFQAWARDNYVPFSAISSIWHPVTRAECEQINLEQKSQWREQLAFLDDPKQDWFNTITDKELTIRLLLAILWQSNRSDCPDNREEWQDHGHANQSNLFGDIFNALKRLGVDDPCEGIDGYGTFDFSGGEE